MAMVSQSSLPLPPHPVSIGWVQKKGKNRLDRGSTYLLKGLPKAEVVTVAWEDYKVSLHLSNNHKLLFLPRTNLDLQDFCLGCPMQKFKKRKGKQCLSSHRRKTPKMELASFSGD